WDDRMLEIFGAKAAPADYAHFLALIHPDDRDLVQAAIAKALETGVFTPFEHRILHPDGLEHWVLGTGTVLRNDSGRSAQLMGGALDITEQKRMTAQLQRAQRVEALGQLTAGLAHNFNNLLVAIIPNLEMAMDDASEGQKPLISSALSASLQARDLIKRLMSITGRAASGPSNTSDARVVLERAVALCQATFPRQIEMSLTIAPDVGHVSIEASDFEQVALNLLCNARDALERVSNGPRLIDVSLDRVTATDPRSVRLRVRDTGPGMSSAVQERVFEPFFTTKSVQHGSGLGLSDALVRVRAAGGTLECQSSEGAGATFTLMLREAPSPKPTAPPASAAPEGSHGETILLVDDEPSVRAVVARILTQEGYQVLEAENADEGRALLSAHGERIKLVLLDQSMPRESGPEALPSFKRLSGAPVVMFSGTAVDVPPGATAVLEKPTTVAELLRLVHDLVK
ncbi:MAG TPA: ATP-binding protein, partial [Polyangia bacterium]